MTNIVGSAAIQIKPDLTGFKQELEAKLKAATSGLDVKVQVTADTGRALAELRAVQTEANRLNGQRIHLQVNADVAKAITEMAAANREADKFNGKNINLDVSGAIGGLLTLRNSLIALAPVAVQATAALAPLVGLLGAVPGGLIGLGQVFGTIKLGFQGISGAIKEVATNQKNAAGTAAKSATAQINYASQIKTAQEGVAAAERSLANVRRDNAVQARADAQAVAEAVQHVADVHHTASQTQVQDLRAIKDAQLAAKDAQVSLNDAREQAARDLLDLNNRSKDATLNAKQAALDLQRQQLETAAILADPTKTALEKAQAQLDLEKATQNVTEANQAETQSAKDAAAANKKGVEGSDQVVRAKKARAQAERDLRDAERQAEEDRVQGVKDIAAAERALAQARQKQGADAKDRADALKSAQVALAQAERSVADARRQNASSLAAAAISAGNTTTAYDGLTQAGKNFVDEYEKVKSTLHGIGDAIQGAMLPGFTSFLADLNTFLPTLTSTFKDTGTALGDFAAAAGDLLNGPFGTKLHGILDANNKVLVDILGTKNGGGLLGLASAFINIGDAARPLTRWIGGLVNDFGLWAKHVTEVNDKNGKLQAFFETTKDTAKTLGDILKNVFTALFNIGHAAFPSGQGLLKSLDDATQKFADWTGTPAAQRKMKQFFDDIKNVFETIASTIVTIVQKMAPLVKQLADFAAKHPELVKAATIGALATQLPGVGIAGNVAGSVLGGVGGRLAGGLLAGGGGEAAAGGAAAGLGGATAVAATGGIAAGIGGLLLLYFKDKTFRHDVDSGFSSALKGVKDAFQPLNDALSKFWDRNGGWITKLGEILVEAFGTEVQNVLKAFGKGFEIVIDIVTIIVDLLNGDWKKAWEATKEGLKDTLSLLEDLWKAFIGNFVTLFEEHVWPWLKKLPGKMFQFVKDHWDDFLLGVNKLMQLAADGIIALWEKIVWPWLKSLPGKMWGFIKDHWDDLLLAFLRFIRDLVSQITGAFLDKARDFFTNLPETLFKLISKGWQAGIAKPLAGLFRDLVDGLGDIWSGLERKFATPVNWIIDHVINPLIHAVESLMHVFDKSFNIPDVKNINIPSNSPAASSPTGPHTGGTQNVASGGVLPGYTPGRDVHTFTSPSAGILNLSGGEAIMRPEWVRLVGGKSVVDEMNERAKRGISHFAAGGLFRPVSGGPVSSVHDQSTGFPAVDIGVPVGSRVAAGASGLVTRSYDITGYEPRRVGPQDGYRSYGRVMYLNHGGFSTLYAHLSQRGKSAGAHVAGGELIGLSGNTGNTTGPHLHFGAQGISPLAFMGGSTAYTGNVGSAGPGGGPVAIFDVLKEAKKAFGAIGSGLGNVPGGGMFGSLAKGVFGMVTSAAIQFAVDKAKALGYKVVTAPLHAAGGLFHALTPFSTGGLVPGTGGGDTVPSMLSPGEYVVNRDAVNRVGASTFDRINNTGSIAGGTSDMVLAQKLDTLIAAVSRQRGGPLVGTVVAQNNVDVDLMIQALSWHEQRLAV